MLLRWILLQLDQHLHQLHLGHAKLIMEIEDTRRASSDLKSRMKELEESWTGKRLPYLMVPRGRGRSLLLTGALPSWVSSTPAVAAGAKNDPP